MNNRNSGGFACTAKDGFLDKYKNFLLGWGTRYIRMDRSYIHNFEARDAPNPSGSIVRGEVTRCSINHSFKGAAGPFVFDVVCRNGTTWYLRARTWEDMADWMVAIYPSSRQELERIRPTPAPPAPAPLPQPLVPVPGATVCEGSPPRKEGLHNPNAGYSHGGESSHGHGSGMNQPPPPPSAPGGNQPPSYSDLFDRYDPAKNH